MRSRFWVMALAQVLDLLFTDQPADGSARTTGKRLAGSTERVLGRRIRTHLLTYAVTGLAPFVLSSYLSRRYRRQWAAFSVALELTLLLWLLLPKAPRRGLEPRSHRMRRLLDKNVWQSRHQRAVELLSLDMPSVPMASVAHTVGWPILRRNLTGLSKPWINQALRRCPGVRSIGDIAGLDGTLAYFSPGEYLRKAPGLLKDSLFLLPPPLMAAALVGGAFLKGKNVGEFQAELAEGDGNVDESPTRKAWHRLLRVSRLYSGERHRWR